MNKDVKLLAVAMITVYISNFVVDSLMNPSLETFFANSVKALINVIIVFIGNYYLRN